MSGLLRKRDEAKQEEYHVTIRIEDGENTNDRVTLFLTAFVEVVRGRTVKDVLRWDLEEKCIELVLLSRSRVVVPGPMRGRVTVEVEPRG